MPEKETQVTIVLPAKWMAKYFIEWVGEAWIDQMRDNEGQLLILATSPNDPSAVIFVRDNRQED